MLKATIFNIVHGSFVDGYGIRTTVFFKGCPLRCKWCCNPESQRTAPELQVIKEHCSGCRKCIEKCPKHAIALQEGLPVIDRVLCDGCGDCVACCWPGALSVWGESKTVDDLYEECLKDQAFYDNSGGGVTLSGGEPTMQAAFCLQLMEKLQQSKIKVAVDTCGQVTSEEGVQLLRRADLILFDVKGLNTDMHLQNTGVSNEIILQNLKRMNEWHKSVIIRYPVIPNHNQAEAEEIARLLSRLECVERVDLIPYHVYGTTKYAELDREYPLAEDQIAEAEQQRLLGLFKSYGLCVQLGG